MLKKVFIFIIIAIGLIVILVYYSISSTTKQFETCEILGFDDVSEIDFSKYDSVLVAASGLYEADFIKEFMQGGNYREAWSTPIKIPIVFLDTLNGGMTVIKEGGGNQTQSLKLKSPNGIEYALRSINKDPKVLIPDFARTLGIENIVIDGVSAQHPYAAIVVAQLAEAVGILHTKPKVVFVPKHEALGVYNTKYGNRIYLLEYESDSHENWTEYKDIVNLMDTDNLQKFKNEVQHVSIDKSMLIRARLFDLIIGDWDRHSGQWGWVVKKQDSTYTAFPIPCDRDNAFFNLEGILPTIISSKNIEPELRPFQNDIDYMPGLVKPFDRYFLYNTPEELFIREAEFLQKQLTDETIDKALKIWPPEIYQLDALSISQKIKSRRDQLGDIALHFKRNIDEQGVLNKSLKGSESLTLTPNLLACFECE